MITKYARTITELDARTGETTVREVDIPIDDIKAEAIAVTKREAERRILAIVPEWKQRNLTARAVELSAIHAGITPENYPEPDRSEWMAGQALWDRIKLIRAASDQIEAEIAALPTTGAIFDYAETLETNPLWPE